MRILLYLIVGLSIGGLSGTLGIGGGVLLVPMLMWLFGYDQPRAAGTTLAILVPPIGLLAAWKYYVQGLIDVEAALWIAGAFAVGAYGGASVVSHIPVSMLRLSFGLIMMYIAARFILASDSETANTAFGLLAMTTAWLAYLGLRLVGRRHLAAPNLGQQIRAMQEQGRGESEYHI